MFIEPRQLIAETIDKLETVATYFPKLRTAQGSLAAASAQLQFHECLHCE